MSLKYSTDKLDVRGFIDKNEILKYVTEKQIYKLVFGFEPEEFQYVTSPLREDKNAGCWFETTEFGLVFRDFTYGKKPMDCFNVVQAYYKLPNFYATLQFIYDKLILNKSLEELSSDNTIINRGEVFINIATRRFTKKDRDFWLPYEISKQNLIDDKVFPVSRYMLENSRNDSIHTNRDLCYAFTNFKKGKKKLYFPRRTGTDRFLTTCKKDDIGEINKLIPFGRQLIISKSYKDCRVLKNQGKHSVWIQNEGMIPSDDSLIPLIKRFSKVVVFYDNDDAGIKASMELSEVINSYFPGRGSYIYLPTILNRQGISDPSDLLKSKGRKELNAFLNKYIS